MPVPTYLLGLASLTVEQIENVLPTGRSQIQYLGRWGLVGLCKAALAGVVLRWVVRCIGWLGRSGEQLVTFGGYMHEISHQA